MNILAIDTSSKLCSVAVLNDKNLIDKIEYDNGLTHSETLMPLIQNLLDKNNLSLKDMGLLVCDIGPGSFTGIRIGVATIKAFSDSLNIPAIGVNSLECYAHNVHRCGLVCSMIDCKNENCYFALYNFDNDIFEILEAPQNNSIYKCIDLLKNNYSGIPITFVGDGSKIYMDLLKKDFENAIFLSDEENILNIYNLGLIGFDVFDKYNSKSLDLPPLLPLYLKKPQAQYQLESKKLEIKKMNISDLNSIDMNEFDDFWNISNLKNDLLSENSIWFIAKIEDVVIGFVGFKKVFDEAEIMDIAVHKNYRMQGIASQMLAYMINEAKLMNIKRINLEVNEKNLPALNLYKKFGFIEIGRRKKYYGDLDAILMRD